MTALKSFTRTIRLPFDGVDVQAFVAHLGGVARINHHHFDSSPNRFVGQENSQLIKCPTIGASAFGLRPRLLIGSFSDSGQIFQSNARRTRFCLGHNGFADDMILIRLITSLSARQSFQDLTASTPCRSSTFRGFALERCSGSSKSVSSRLDIFTTPTITIAGNGNVRTPQIDTDYSDWFGNVWRGGLNLDVDVVVTISMSTELSRCWFLAVKINSLIFSNIQRNAMTTIHQRQADNVVLLPEVKNSSIVIDASRVKRLYRLLFSFSGFPIGSDSSANTNSQVSTQPKHGSQVLIDQILNGYRACGLGLDCLVSIVATISKSLQCCLDLGDVFRSWTKFANDGKYLFHALNNITCDINKQWFDLKEQGICSPSHTPAHRARAAPASLWAGAIGGSLAFLPPLTLIGSTLAVQRGHPAVLGEVYALSNVAAAIAKPILDNLTKLGFANRGVKSAPLYVIKNTSMPAVLIEVCFLDSMVDMAVLDKVGTDRIAEAIKHALIGTHEGDGQTKSGVLKITSKTVLKPSTEQSSDLPPTSLIEILPGNYPIVDYGFEERHWWVKWPDKTKGNRDKHFIFEKFGRVESPVLIASALTH
jgi:hypothetical protein